jgi:hypothetical protein
LVAALLLVVVLRWQVVLRWPQALVFSQWAMADWLLLVAALEVAALALLLLAG